MPKNKKLEELISQMQSVRARHFETSIKVFGNTKSCCELAYSQRRFNWLEIGVKNMFSMYVHIRQIYPDMPSSVNKSLEKDIIVVLGFLERAYNSQGDTGKIRSL